jgi:hypothetical protein
MMGPLFEAALRRVKSHCAVGGILLLLTNTLPLHAQSFHQKDLSQFASAAETLFEGGSLYSVSETELGFQIPERRAFVRVILGPDEYEGEAYYRSPTFSADALQKRCNERNSDCVVRFLDMGGAVGVNMTFQYHGEGDVSAQASLHRDGSLVTVFSDALDRKNADANLMKMLSFLQGTLLKE